MSCKVPDSCARHNRLHHGIMEETPLHLTERNDLIALTPISMVHVKVFSETQWSKNCLIGLYTNYAPQQGTVAHKQLFSVFSVPRKNFQHSQKINIIDSSNSSLFHTKEFTLKGVNTTTVKAVFKENLEI